MNYDYIDSDDRLSRAVAWAMSRPCRPRGGTACIVGARHGGCAGRAGSPRAVAPRAADWTTLGRPTTLYGVRQFMLIVIDRRRHADARTRRHIYIFIAATRYSTYYYYY